QGSAGLLQQPRADVHTDQHATLTQSAEEPLAERPRSTAQLDHPVVWAQRQVVEQALGLLSEVGILDLQSPRRPLRLAQDVTLLAHALASVGSPMPSPKRSAKSRRAGRSRARSAAPATRGPGHQFNVAISCVHCCPLARAWLRSIALRVRL